MKSLLGGMASFRIATFLSVLIIPVVSFFRPIFGVGSSITLMFQAFVCARIGMDYCKTDRDKMIAGVMAAVLATQGTACWFRTEYLPFQLGPKEKITGKCH